MTLYARDETTLFRAKMLLYVSPMRPIRISSAAVMTLEQS